MTGDAITDGSGDPPGGGSARTWLIVLGGLLALGAVVAIAVAVSGGDSEDSATTEVAASAAPDSEPDTSAAETNPPETSPPETEPPETEPPETSPPETEPPETEPPATEPPDNGLEFTIDEIEDGGVVPQPFTCDGVNQAPLVMVNSIPDNTQQLAFVVDDPDAPSADPFVHWVVYGIPPATTTITDGVDEFTYGLNDVQLLDWFGPCPPPGDGPHRYSFTLYSLTGALQLDPGLDGRQLFDAIEPLIQAETELVATYER